MKYVCDPKTTKAQDDARNKKLTAGEIQQLIKKANSGDMSAIATLSRSYDFKSIIGTDTRTKEEIEAGNRLVWQNTVNSLKKIPYLLGEFLFVNDIYRLTTGKDPETGEAASRLEAAGWLIAGLASFGISKVVKGGELAGKGLKALDKVNDASKVAKAADKANDASKAAKADVVSEVRFSDKFTHSKYKNQIAERGWDNKKIAETINNPIKTTKGYNKYTKSTVTNYYIDDIHYVAVDDSTGKVIQIADLTKPNWKGPR